MTRFPTRPRRRTVLGAALAAGFIAGGPLAASTTAHAALACRSDPLVVLSNGVTLDLSATIYDDVTDVQQVAYTLQAPQGVTVVRTITTDGAVGYKEHFAVQPLPPGAAANYTAVVQVTLATKTMTFQAFVAGGYASTLGVTPAMVGLTAWAPAPASTTKTPPPPKGSTTLSMLPSTVTSAVLSWAASAPWSATAASTTVLSGQRASAGVTL